MKKKKRAKTGGRQKLPPGKARITISGRVLPETKDKIETQAASAKLSVGKFLDFKFKD